MIHPGADVGGEGGHGGAGPANSHCGVLSRNLDQASRVLIHLVQISYKRYSWNIHIVHAHNMYYLVHLDSCATHQTAYLHQKQSWA